MFSSSASVFDRIAPRPPTPPRELSKAVDDAIAYLDDSNEIDRLLSSSSAERRLSEPVSAQSPASSRVSAHPDGGSKRVGFSLHPFNVEIDSPSQEGSPDSSRIKRSPSTRNAKPARSILKVTNPSLPLTPDNLESKLGYCSPNIPGSFAKMLQSVIQQLAGPSGSSRLDAYLALNGVLRAYEDVPDLLAMAQKMTLFMQFLTRDMAWKDSEGNLDINIITQALKLTSAILAMPSLADALDDDFKAFLIDRSIAVFEKPDIPKAVMKAHFNIAAQPRFHSKALSAGKADKIITLLKNIETRCSGNGVIAGRMVIYLRMLEHSSAVMLARIDDWLEHVFHGMLSSIKDVRTQAIKTCTHAGFVFGQHPQAAKALHEMLAAEVEDGQTYYDFLTLRLVKMTSEKEVGPYVPQIWATILLFFRSKRWPLWKWPKFKSWLRIAQRCLNSSDNETKHQATLAWNKLVFTVMPDASTDSGLLSLLTVPILKAIEKRSAERNSQHARQCALDSYYNLLYYAFRPGLTKEDYDTAWDINVGPILSELATTGAKGRVLACRILHGLLNGNTGVWDPNAAIEQVVIKPEGLPRLDPRWVRSRLDRILKIMEPVTASGMWSRLDANTASDATWYYLMQSVANAGVQEVKTSNELKEAIALLVNVLRRLWNDCNQSELGATDPRWLRRYLSILSFMTTGLGTGPFAEDILAATDDDNIEVARTPSHKHSKQFGPPQSPFFILLEQFRHPSNTLKSGMDLKAAIDSILELSMRSKSTVTAKLALLDHFLQGLSIPVEVQFEGSVENQIWRSVSSTAITVLRDSSISMLNVQEPQSIGQGLRFALNILATGLVFPVTSSRDFSFYYDRELLYDFNLETAKTLAGDGAVVLAVMEPFAKALANPDQVATTETKLRLGYHLLEQAVWPKSRQSLEQAFKLLWGVNLAPQKSIVFDPFEHVYTLIDNLTRAAYREFDHDSPSNFEATNDFIRSILSFLDRSPLSLLAPALRKIQGGLSVWIEDGDRKTGTLEQASKLVCDTWACVSRLLSKLPSKDSRLLKAVDTLLAAGFSSPHKAVVNDCILFWNKTFGTEQSLDYPSKLEDVLRARAVDAEISLPTFPESNPQSDVVSLPTFFDTQSQSSASSTPSKRTSDLQNGRHYLSASQPGLQNAILTTQRISAPQPTSFSSPARKATRRSVSSTPKARLRHDNSQIQFAPIESSPLPVANDSQLLTEHQKEVKSRQHETAQLFPDFSSSPIAQSTALPRGVSKRLDFTSKADTTERQDVQDSPLGLADRTEPMSDDLPSSPTPSSGRDATQDLVEDDDDQIIEDDAEGPPSSPPQTTREMVFDQIELDATVDRDDARPDDTTVDVTASSVAGQQVPSNPADAPVDGLVDTEADLPSDSILPDMQLQLEEEAASDQVMALQPADESQEQGGDAVRELPQSEENVGAHQSQIDTEVEEDVSRVENSVIEPVKPADEEEEDSQSKDGSQQIQRVNKKRKRGTTTAGAPPKKRKPQSPFKRFAAYIWGQSQQDDDDDDMEDEIVVASSLRALSPDREVSEVPTETTSQSAESKAAADIAPADKDEDEESQHEEVQKPAKRPRGRPRKSVLPTASEQNVQPANKLKRKASTLSNAAVADGEATSIVVEATPATSRAKKELNYQDVAPLDDQQSQPGVSTRRSVRQKAVAVVVSKKHSDAADEQIGMEAEVHHSAVSVEDETVSLENTDMATVTEPTVTPRGILKRLKDALVEFGKVRLGSQEEREFDDVLFELRREMHEAGRRGREQQD